ncbi:hypothetical protein LTR70_008641 [Exophiala xenobiotica]|uniref:Uncharacterized protein n=1 Tax=Lithohypha guttulata TaxID=1690604 RepID=A0ABR0K0B3_9EURO|nr:hypothetical protein LTR24_008476 [Lithohypha guttulata]KAK5311655.1 hypothetical protein LTR70_008641 [Exophiala xenobiotica]
MAQHQSSDQDPSLHTTSVAKSTPSDASGIAPADLENRLHQTLSYYNKLAKNLDIDATPPENVAVHEIEAAKMLNYCIRMLHADGWHPPTIIRAMVLRESNPDTSMKGVMYRALRERRLEIEVWRMQKGMVPEGAKMAKNSALGKVDHNGTGSGAGGRNDTRGGQT